MVIAVSGHTAPPSVIDLSAIEKQFITPQGSIKALAKTDFSVKKGELVVLLGPSGCGKTTLLRLIAGLERPSAGAVRIGNSPLWKDGRRDNAAAANLGMVFQDANLFPWFTVAENIALPLKLRGMPRRRREARVAELCKLVGLSGFEDRWPRELSGGMRQRAAIARALSYEPQILLMDEPFGALDAITRDAMNVELQRIWLQTAKTIVLVTHSIQEAVFLADRIALLSPRPGRIDGVFDVPFQRPRDKSVHTLPEFQGIAASLRSRLDH